MTYHYLVSKVLLFDPDSDIFEVSKLTNVKNNTQIYHEGRKAYAKKDLWLLPGEYDETKYRETDPERERKISGRLYRNGRIHGDKTRSSGVDEII